MNESNPLFQACFLAPRYWHRWLLFAGMFLAARLPFGFTLRLGRALGRLGLRFAKERRQIAETNLAICFPDMAASERAALLRQHFESLGMGAAETSLCWWGSQARLRPLLREIEGQEYLEAALARGHGALLLGAHFTHLEIGISLLAAHRPTAAVYKPHKDPLFEVVMSRSRAHYGRAIRRDDTRGMLRALRDNLPLWYAADQNYRGKHMAYVPFFGMPAATNTATSRLAQISKAPLLTFHQRRLPGAEGYRLIFSPPVEGFPTGDVAADARRVSQLVEALVRDQPADYLWVHRRFKTQAVKADNPYPPRRRRRRKPRQAPA